MRSSIQVLCSSLENPTWPDGHPYYGKPFVWPAEGTLLKAEKSSGLPDIKFSMEHVLNGISYRSLEGRVKKGTNGDGKTNKKKVLRLQDYQLRFTNGIARYYGSEFLYLNDCGVMEVQFVKTSKLTTTQSGRKRNSSDAEVQAEYEASYKETVVFFKRKGCDVDKLQKSHLIVLLWCGFKQFSRKNQTGGDNSTSSLKTKLKKEIQDNPKWLD